MTLVLTLLVLAVVVAVAAVATGRITGGLDDPVSSLPARLLPEHEIGPDDVERVRFSPALRGYRMQEVDQVLDRLVLELARRDEAIARLQQRLAAEQAEGPGPDGGASHDPRRLGERPDVATGVPAESRHVDSWTSPEVLEHGAPAYEAHRPSFEPFEPFGPTNGRPGHDPRPPGQEG